MTPPTEKWAFFRTFSRAPPPGGDTLEILLANYKGPPMPFHYLYNWLLPLARFRKSLSGKKMKKEKVTLAKYTSRADRPGGLSRRRRMRYQCYKNLLLFPMVLNNVNVLGVRRFCLIIIKIPKVFRPVLSGLSYSHVGSTTKSRFT